MCTEVFILMEHTDTHTHTPHAHTHTHTHKHTGEQRTQYKSRCVEPKARSDADDSTHDKCNVIWHQSATHSAHHSHQVAGQNHRFSTNPVQKVTSFILL